VLPIAPVAFLHGSSLLLWLNMVPCLPQPDNGHGIWLPALPLSLGFPHCSYKSRDFLTCRASDMYCVVALTPTQRDLRFDIFALRDEERINHPDD